MEKKDSATKTFHPLDSYSCWRRQIVKGMVRKNLAVSLGVCIVIYGSTFYIRWSHPLLLPFDPFSLPILLLMMPAIFLFGVVLTIGRYNYLEELRERERWFCHIEEWGIEWKDKKRHIKIPWSAVKSLRHSLVLGKPVFWVFFRGGKLTIDQPWISEEMSRSIEIKVEKGKIFIKRKGSQWEKPDLWKPEEHPLIVEIEAVSGKKF